MKINMWIRTASEYDRTPTMRIDVKYETRDTPTVQRFAKKLLRAIGWDDKNPSAPFVVYETNGEIINALNDLAEGNLEAAVKAIHDGDLEQTFRDAAKIVEAYTLEHGDEVLRNGDTGGAK